MAKLYDFRIVLREAIFDGKSVAVCYHGSKSVYAEKCVQATLRDAIRMRQELSDAEPRSHAAFLSMKYRDDRAAQGLSKVPVLYVERV